MKTEDLLRYEAEFRTVREALGGATLIVKLTSAARAGAEFGSATGGASLKVASDVDIGSSRPHDLDRSAR